MSHNHRKVEYETQSFLTILWFYSSRQGCLVIERSRNVHFDYALLPKYPNRLGGCYTLATLSLGQLEAKAIDYYKQSLVITKEIRDVNLQALE